MMNMRKLRMQGKRPNKQHSQNLRIKEKEKNLKKV